MATIRDNIKATMPRTFEIMDARYPNVDPVPPGAGTLGIVDSTVSRVLATLFPSGAITEATLSEGAKLVVSDIAARELISPAIDHFQHEARVSEGGQGESIAYYDLIKGLQTLEARLRVRINETAHLLDAVDDTAAENRPSAAPRVSSAGTAFKTTAPSAFPPIVETL